MVCLTYFVYERYNFLHAGKLLLRYLRNFKILFNSSYMANGGRKIIPFILLIVSVNAGAQQVTDGNKNAACTAIGKLKKSLPDITANARKYIWGNNDDTCVLLLIDKISALAISTHDVSYIKALDAIGAVSDGYVSDDLMDLCTDQFYKNFKTLMNFCYAHNSSLKGYLIEGLSADMSAAEDQVAYRKKMVAFAKKTMGDMKMVKGERDYINDILAHVDLKMFD